MKTAAQVFSELGFEGADMERIAAEAGIAKGTLYLYFSSKEDLLLSTLKMALSHFSEQIHKDVIREKEGLQQLKTMVRAYFHYLEVDGSFARMIVQHGGQYSKSITGAYMDAFKGNASHVEAILRNGTACGEFHVQNVKVTARTILHLLFGTSQSLLLGREETQLQVLAISVENFIISAIVKGGTRP
jgi:TetR/AcrR family fatty acid metabolism transcriptional regulator